MSIRETIHAARVEPVPDPNEPDPLAEFNQPSCLTAEEVQRMRDAGYGPPPAIDPEERLLREWSANLDKKEE